MKVLVIGSGGREHALVWKIAQSPRVEKVYCAPGNAGIGEIAELVDLAPDNLKGLRQFAEKERIELTVVGPELPLSLGVVDEFELYGLKIFGPNQKATQIEASKAFAKGLLRRCNIPTPYFGVFSDPEEAKTYIEEVGVPIVVKADGLAGGKGVLICTTLKEAYQAVDEIMRGRLFGDAGERIVVEEFLEGEEASFMAFTDGQAVLPLAPAQDYKRAFDGDRGPNTGGMGAYSPPPVVTPTLATKIMNEIMIPTVRGLRQRQIKYKGVLYAGLMVQGQEAKVLEFNARFGDPECQPLIVRLKSDLVEIMEAVIEERLEGAELHWDERAAVCVVLAADGYPGSYERGRKISGLARLRHWKKGAVFHAGTAKSNGKLVTHGGRVLGVTAMGGDLNQAIAEVYRAVEKIKWQGMHYRKDIGRRALARL
jgi:phosphoribosylamine--glycine ligase